jgi:hypothetical protein
MSRHENGASWERLTCVKSRKATSDDCFAALKKQTHFEQVPLNVLKGETKMHEHLQRHPFGKIPVLN